MRSLRVLCACVALVLVSCSSAADTDAGTAESTSSPDGGRSPTPGGTTGKKGRTEPGAHTDGANAGESRTKQQKKESGASDQVPSASESTFYPAAGTYLFDQEGYEEFCQATCDRQDLPATQRVEYRYRSRSQGAAVVVSEARSSEERTMRTTTKWTRTTALITEVTTSFEWSGFEFVTTYQPKPPVESLRFPLQVGDRWSGRWEAKTSGEYDISVVAEEGDAFRIGTATRFEGEFDGTADITVWLDPDTRSIVAAEGTIDVESGFGTYRSEFDTSLRSGPGYS
jgi:hypothetical protein